MFTYLTYQHFMHFIEFSVIFKCHQICLRFLTCYHFTDFFFAALHIIALWQFSERIIEDFEIIKKEDEKCYLEIRQCPFKYELFRRPMLLFPKHLAYIKSQDYSIIHHESLIEDYLKNLSINHHSNHQDLRLRARLKWTFLTKRDNLRWQYADFLLKTDPKLGGVLMYNTTSSKVTFLLSSRRKIAKLLKNSLADCL